MDDGRTTRLTPRSVLSVDGVHRRLDSLGVDALSNQELLALVLHDAGNGTRALAAAQAILDDFGSLTVLSTARREELARGLRAHAPRASALVAAFELSRRTGRVEPTQLRSAADVAAAARPLLDGARQERLVVLICDASNRLRRTVLVAEGAVDRSAVPVREILNAVLRHDGRAFALAHNHPSGAADPSDSDRRSTEVVQAAASVVGLRFLGHVVVADDNWQDVA